MLDRHQAVGRFQKEQQALGVAFGAEMLLLRLLQSSTEAGAVPARAGEQTDRDQHADQNAVEPERAEQKSHGDQSSNAEAQSQGGMEPRPAAEPLPAPRRLRLDGVAVQEALQ